MVFLYVAILEMCTLDPIATAVKVWHCRPIVSKPVKAPMIWRLIL